MEALSGSFHYRKNSKIIEIEKALVIVLNQIETNMKYVVLTKKSPLYDAAMERICYFLSYRSIQYKTLKLTKEYTVSNPTFH